MPTWSTYRPIIAHSSVTASQNSSDLVSYAISKAPPKHQQPSNEKSQHTEKIGSENLNLGDDRAHEITSRVQNTRTTRFEKDFKTLIKKLENREKIVTQRLDKRNHRRVTNSLTFTVSTESTLPFQLSLKVMYSWSSPG
jgi:hypothetical protein